MSMTFDTKIAIVVRDDLAVWQKLNITAFVSGALAGTYPEIIGETYRDAANNAYMPMVIQPIMVYQANADGLKKAYRRAMEREVKMAIFTAELFTTSNDIDNRAAVAAQAPETMDFVGIAMRDLKKTVDSVIKGLKLHP